MIKDPLLYTNPPHMFVTNAYHSLAISHSVCRSAIHPCPCSLDTVAWPAIVADADCEAERLKMCQACPLLPHFAYFFPPGSHQGLRDMLRLTSYIIHHPARILRQAAPYLTQFSIKTLPCVSPPNKSYSVCSGTHIPLYSIASG